ncbi:HK97 family phage prohead protease [Halovulum sp. GXIMD14794]
MDRLQHGGLLSSSLEVRAAGNGSRTIKGKFPYGKRAVMHSGGNGRRPQKEEFAPRAFEFAVNDPKREIHLLVGHSYDQPLASRRAGTLTLRDTDEALFFDAEITPEIQQTTFWTNFWAAYTSNLMLGLSPGFRVAPPEVAPDAEETEEEDPEEGNALIRVIRHAVLFELSLVTRPAYEETEVEARSAFAAFEGNGFAHLRRWRV